MINPNHTFALVWERLLQISCLQQDYHGLIRCQWLSYYCCFSPCPLTYCDLHAAYFILKRAHAWCQADLCFSAAVWLKLVRGPNPSLHHWKGTSSHSGRTLTLALYVKSQNWVHHRPGSTLAVLNVWFSLSADSYSWICFAILLFTLEHFKAGAIDFNELHTHLSFTLLGLLLLLWWTATWWEFTTELICCLQCVILLCLLVLQK